MIRFARWIALGILAVAATSLGAAPKDWLDVRLSVPTPVVRGDVDVTVTVTVTNATRHPVNLLRWQLPTDELQGPLFRITRDGEPVAYTGPLVKRTAPGPADHVKLDAGASLTYDVELTAAYDLSSNGRYAIQYANRGAYGANGAALRSDTLYLWLEGRSSKVKRPPPPPPPGQIFFTGNCSASQQLTLTTAVHDATTYASGATNYLVKDTIDSRYTTWFGTYETGHYSTVEVNFTAIRGAFEDEALTLDCKCKKANVYAYVYPNTPYVIYVCGAFWAAPATGTDSKAGTLIHEMSHFYVVASTNDYVYGQAGAKALALSNPDEAIDNADNYEYFSENNPPLP
jgi:peptidyl-Lys metalloendopeptidase